MKLDKRLNLVLPISREGVDTYVHSMPIGREVFERYFKVLSRTFSEVIRDPISGPRVAYLTLKDIATNLGQWDDVERGLMNEIRRLSNVVAPADKGWATFQFQDAIDQSYFDEDDLREVENALVFFTVALWMTPKKERAAIIDGFASLWSAQLVSSSCTEFAASLPTSTATASIGEKAIPSFIPQ